MRKKISVSTPLLGHLELEAVSRVLRKGEISGTFGECISKFENKFSSFVGCKYGVAVPNGTLALHLALATINIKPGDEVLVSTLTNMATIFAIRYVGGVPVPIDIEKDTWNLNPALLEMNVSRKTRAILVVHLFGHPVDMDPVIQIAKKYKLYVIEDAAQAHGAEYKGKRVGSLGDIACFSFYANKILTTGEGGMVVTNNKNFAERARLLGTLSYGNRRNRFMHKEIGFNYRMSNIHAAIGLSQLQRIERVISLKAKIARMYNHLLKEIEGIQLPIQKEYAKNVYWMYHIVLQKPFHGRRDAVMESLLSRGIETRQSFVPANAQKIFIKEGLMRKESCPVANYVGANGFYLPSGPVISPAEIKYVAKTISNVMLEMESKK